MAEWEEKDHPRDGNNQKFVKKGSDGAYNSQSDGAKEKAKAVVEKHKATGKGKEQISESPKLNNSNPKEFHKTLSIAKENTLPEDRWRVDIHNEADYANDKLYVSKGGSCVAIDDGNIISVCHNAGDTVRGRDLLAFAVKNGGDRLDAFGKGLYHFYTKNGFEPVSWTPFNEDYAPDGWESEYGKEPVIFYKYTGNRIDFTYDEFINKVKPSKDYDSARDIRDKEIKK